MFSAYDSAIALTTFTVALAVLVALKALLLKQLERWRSGRRLEFLGYPEQLIAATRFTSLAVIALLVAVSQLDLDARQEKWLHYAWVIALVVQIAVWANCLVTVSVERSFARHRGSDPSAATHLMMVGIAARIAVWTIAVLAALDNLGFNITTLMASLGIGGIAVALAVQNILGDLFSSISIALDKPFVIGDFITVDDYMGTVEYVGLKTTRIRSLGGEQIIFSNTELLKNRIRNFKRMEERRAQFQFGVSYDTPPDRLEAIPAMLREIVEAAGEKIRFDRAHFTSFGDSALNFEVVYFVLDPDYNLYMDLQQEFNLKLMRRLRERGVSFAHPMLTLHVPAALDALPLPRQAEPRMAGRSH